MDARVRVSKFLSRALRHEPERVGIVLDEHGWTDVAALLDACARKGVAITREELAEIVATSDKQRFALSEDGARIRANQGHSVEVDLALAPTDPPARLYHGTTPTALDGVRATGLDKRERHHVHLSADVETARRVGGRRGRPVVLTVRAGQMAAEGHVFYRSDNGVWLTEHVPVAYLDFPPSHPTGPARDERVRIAETTLAACEAGGYINARGERISLAQWIAQARRLTTLHDLGRLPECPRKLRAGAITFAPMTTIEALRALATERAQWNADGRDTHGQLGCLNFASARNPGGGFLRGAQAQEEALARSSALYPCLLEQPTYYERHHAHRSAMYLDLAIASVLVPFFRDDAGGWLDAPVLASVITCAAPNAHALREHRAFDAAEVLAAFERRTAGVLELAAAEGIEWLVLGAWGAGAFGNDPQLVARTFADALAPRRHLFERIVFAVPPGPNHDCFAARFRD